MLFQMAKFMGDHIVHHSIRSYDNPPVENDIPLSTATAPPSLECLDADGGGDNSDDLGLPHRFLPELLLCMDSVPLC